MKIFWTREASLDNLQNIEYLIREWSLSVALGYEEKVVSTERLLLKNPYAGQYEEFLNLRKILVVPQIYMLYEIKGNVIYVVRMWNNHRKPYW